MGHRVTFEKKENNKDGLVVLCLLMRGAVMMRPRWRLIEVHRDRHRMENRVWASVRDEVQVRPQQRRLDRQGDVESTAIVQSENRHPMRRRRFLGGGRWRWTRLYPLRGEPLLDGALELVIGRLAAGCRRRAVRMGAVIAVVADDHRRRDVRRLQGTLWITERAHTGARALVRVRVRLTYRGNAGVSVAAVDSAVRRRHLGMREP